MDVPASLLVLAAICVLLSSCTKEETEQVRAPVTCADGIMNGLETDIDCGGPDCPPCSVGQNCVLVSDCGTAPITCANGTADIGLFSDTTSSDNVSPFIADAEVSRAQYLFRQEELDLSISQLNGPNFTEGLCAGEPISSVALNICGWDGVAVSGSFTSLMRITVKHTSLSAMSNDFDDTTDPAGQCVCWAPSGCQYGTPNVWPLPTTTGWMTFNLTNPFVWNGVDNIIVEFCYTRSAGSGTAVVAATHNLPFNGSLHKWGPIASGSCGNTASAQCGGSFTPGFPIAGCGMVAASCGNASAVNSRPVIRFGGIVASASPLTTACCNNTCTDLVGDANNCGACGVICPTGQTCVNGNCQ